MVGAGQLSRLLLLPLLLFSSCLLTRTRSFLDSNVHTQVPSALHSRRSPRSRSIRHHRRSVLVHPLSLLHDFEAHKAPPSLPHSLLLLPSLHRNLSSSKLPDQPPKLQRRPPSVSSRRRGGSRSEGERPRERAHNVRPFQSPPSSSLVEANSPRSLSRAYQSISRRTYRHAPSSSRIQDRRSSR